MTRWVLATAAASDRLRRPCRRPFSTAARAVVPACAAAAIFALTAPVARAQQRPVAAPSAPGTPVRSLSLQEAVRLALAHNPDSRSAEEDVRAARGALVQSHAFDNPALFINTLGDNVSPPDAPTPNQIGLSWTIPIGGKRGARIAGARADLAAAKSSAAAAHRQLAFAVHAAFVAALRDRAQLAFIKQNEATIQQTLQINELRYKDGKIAYGDVLKLRIQARQVENSVREAQLALEQDRAEIARLVGDGVLAPDYTLEGQLTAPSLPAGLTATKVLVEALQRRPDYRALLAQEQSAQAAVTEQKRTPIPDLDVFADYNYDPSSAGNFDLGISANIPIFDRNQGAVSQAQAEYRKAHLATESLRNQIRADALKAVEAWQTSRARLQVYDKDLLKAAAQSLDISRHSYQQGRGTLLDYLDAESSYRQVESAYRSAIADAMLAAAKVRFVAGEELP